MSELGTSKGGTGTGSEESGGGEADVCVGGGLGTSTGTLTYLKAGIVGGESDKKAGVGTSSRNSFKGGANTDGPGRTEASGARESDSGLAVGANFTSGKAGTEATCGCGANAEPMEATTQSSEGGGKIRGKAQYLDAVDPTCVEIAGCVGWRLGDEAWEARKERRKKKELRSLLLSTSVDVRSPIASQLLDDEQRRKKRHIIRLRYIASALRIGCCPPLPNYIFRKIIFPAPKASYLFRGPGPIYEVRYTRELGPGKTQGGPVPSADWLSQVEGSFVEADDGGRLAMALLRGNDQGCVLFCHGNATDIGIGIPLLFKLRRKLGYSVASFDYRGYGQSSGRVWEGKEPRFLADAEIVLAHLLRLLKLPPQKLVIIGFSLGTSVAAYLGTRETKLGALVLAGGFCSTLSVPKVIGACYFPPPTLRCGDKLVTYARIGSVQAPTLMVHGLKDGLIPPEHSRYLLARLQRPAKPLFITHASHNDLFDRPQLIHHLINFLVKDAGFPVPHSAARELFADHLRQRLPDLHPACLEILDPFGICRPCRQALIRHFIPDPAKLVTLDQCPTVRQRLDECYVSLHAEPSSSARSQWEARFALLVQLPLHAHPGESSKK